MPQEFQHPIPQPIFDKIMADFPDPKEIDVLSSDPSFRSYIGSKIILAAPMTEQDFFKYKNKPFDNNQENREGYLVQYPDNYSSWSPKSVFEQAYRLVSDSEKLLLTGQWI